MFELFPSKLKRLPVTLLPSPVMRLLLPETLLLLPLGRLPLPLTSLLSPKFQLALPEVAKLPSPKFQLPLPEVLLLLPKFQLPLPLTVFWLPVGFSAVSGVPPSPTGVGVVLPPAKTGLLPSDVSAGIPPCSPTPRGLPPVRGLFSPAKMESKGVPPSSFKFQFPLPLTWLPSPKFQLPFPLAWLSFP